MSVQIPKLFVCLLHHLSCPPSKRPRWALVCPVTAPFHPHTREDFPLGISIAAETGILLFKLPLVQHIISPTVAHVYQTRRAREKLVRAKRTGMTLEKQR